MPKYILNHTLLGPFGGTDANRKVLKPELGQGAVVTESELRDAGFDGKEGRRSIEDLLTARPGGYAPAVSVLRGTEDYVEPTQPTGEVITPDTGGQDDTAPKPAVAVDGKPIKP